MDAALLKAVNAARRERRALVVVTRLADASARIVTDGEDFAGDPLRAEIATAMRTGKSRTVDTPEGEVFLTVAAPPPRLVAIGAVHITQALAPIAAVVGFDLIVVDPRTAFATPERFAGVRLIADWPDAVLPGLGLDRYTALAAVTHDPKIDDFALCHALERGCFYVGALGSRKTHAGRRERLIAAGVPESEIDSIRAPIGLDIEASSPAEIAVAVMAEVIEAFRRRRVGSVPPGPPDARS
ncbi:MAG TPA: XdhC family protein [Methylomirabilota bacterium]|nr:XdhC family protein [Methylomirabilota bacterium]